MKTIIKKIEVFDPFYGIFYSAKDSDEERRVTYDIRRDYFIDYEDKDIKFLNELKKQITHIIDTIIKRKREIKVVKEGKRELFSEILDIPPIVNITPTVTLGRAEHEIDISSKDYLLLEAVKKSKKKKKELETKKKSL